MYLEIVQTNYLRVLLTWKACHLDRLPSIWYHVVYSQPAYIQLILYNARTTIMKIRSIKLNLTDTAVCVDYIYVNKYY